MSTRAQIAIQTGPKEWAHVYVHYDGYPTHMLPALARWTPKDILTASEIRQVRADELDCFDPPQPPKMLPCPTREFCHLYVWQNEAWVEIDPDALQPEWTPTMTECSPNCLPEGETLTDLVRHNCAIGFDLRFCRSVAVSPDDRDTITCDPGDAKFATLYAPPIWARPSRSMTSRFPAPGPTT